LTGLAFASTLLAVSSACAQQYDNSFYPYSDSLFSAKFYARQPVVQGDTSASYKVLSQTEGLLEAASIRRFSSEIDVSQAEADKLANQLQPGETIVSREDPAFGQLELGGHPHSFIETKGTDGAYRFSLVVVVNSRTAIMAVIFAKDESRGYLTYMLFASSLRLK
jgi:hypothetical protein